jgi:hypothetical protein
LSNSGCPILQKIKLSQNFSLQIIKYHGETAQIFFGGAYRFRRRRRRFLKIGGAKPRLPSFIFLNSFSLTDGLNLVI